MEFQEIRELKKAHFDIACGGNKQKGFIGLDKRDLPGVDIVIDLEDFPWRPIPDECCAVAVSSHFMEHLCPKKTLPFMDEVWRILEIGGTFAVSVPYAGSRGFWQDPSHCNGLNEVTWQYFDPHFPLYGIYKPKPWKIQKGFPVYQNQGNMEVILTKLDPDLTKAIEDVSGKDIGISVAEIVATDERIGG
jgi:SAM-dependent methyltransferase